MRSIFNSNEKRNKKGLIILLVSIVIAMTFISSVFYIRFIRDMTNENAYNNITELSEQTATQLNLSIQNQMKFIDIIVEFINKGYPQELQDIFDRFNPDLDSYHFTRLVILDRKGNGVTSDGYEVENYPNISEFFEKDGVYLSENRPSTVSNQQVNIYSKTFEFSNEDYVLFATIKTENYKEILSRRLFGGEGGTYLINNQGIVLIDSFDSINDTNVNLYEYIKEEYELTSKKDIENIDKMKKNILEGKVATFDFASGSGISFLHYEKLNVNEWYVVSVAPDNTISKKSGLFLGLSLLLCFIINFIVIGILIYIYFSNQRKNKRLYEAAYVDPVTALKNELYFREHAMKYLENNKEKYVMVIDIDNFKKYNKMYDYEFCNLILRNFGKKIEAILPKDNITCRMSRDIFVCAFCYTGIIEKLLTKINSAVAKLDVEGKFINIDSSLGVYNLDNDDNINVALEKANMAHSRIKGIYNEKFYVFDEKLENRLLEKQKIEADMEAALENNEFKIIYQPKISTTTKKLVGAEALVRWHSADGMISPSKFIPIFEENKFILKLDLYVFEQVCKDIVELKKKYGNVPIISVNVSKENFVNENFIDEYVENIKKYGIKAKNIELEITESAMVDEGTDIMKILSNIKKKGFIVSIDDFGTGTSSLSLLQDIPIDIIKIDKTFIDNADLNSNENLINYIEFIAKKLGVKTIVEGVETEKQVEFICKLKCDMIQGYYYSKPILKEEFEEKFLDSENSK